MLLSICINEYANKLYKISNSVCNSMFQSRVSSNGSVVSL